MNLYSVWAGRPGEEYARIGFAAEDDEAARRVLGRLMRTRPWGRSWILKDGKGKAIERRMLA